MNYKQIAFIIYCLINSKSVSYGQSTKPQNDACFYLGLEGVIFANQFTHFTQTAPYLSAADKDLTPRPAVLVGYQATPRLAVELRVQDLPVLTGYSYQQALPTSYLGFGGSYIQDYLYLPIQAVWRVTGMKSRLALSIVAGGGPAWTDMGASLITPNGTKVFTSSGDGTIGNGPTPGPGIVTATVTQYLDRQQGFFVGLETGLRGTWQPLPRLGLDLTVRQLWSTTQSARAIQLTIQTDNKNISTTMETPVQGICTGLSIHYIL